MPTLLRQSFTPARFDARDRVAPAAPGAARRRGRPPRLAPDEVMERIRDAASRGALFRIHREQPALYARARRLWGSWAGALLAAGVDYGQAIADARLRALASRRRPAPGEARHA